MMVFTDIKSGDVFTEEGAYLDDGPQMNLLYINYENLAIHKYSYILLYIDL